MLRYYKQLRQLGIVFDFIALGEATEEDFYDDLRSTGTKIFHAPTLRQGGLHGTRRVLKNILDEEDPYDAVHVHVGHLVGVYSSILLSLRSPKIIAHAHTAFCPNPRHRVLMPLLRWLSRISSDHLFACGPEAGLFCFGGRAVFEILPNGLDPDEYASWTPTMRSLARNTFGPDTDEFVIGMVAAFIPQKNHAFAVQLFEVLTSIRPHSRLVLIGTGPLLPEIEGLVRALDLENRVNFLGTRSDVPRLLPGLDALILPSLGEGMPLISIEAQASGLTCLLSDKVTHTADIGAGLASFLPLSDIRPWVETLSLLPLRSEPDQRIREHLTASGYDIRSSADILERAYSRP